MDQATLNMTAEIVGKHGKIVNPRKGEDWTDPFLIAQADMVKELKWVFR